MCLLDKSFFEHMGKGMKGNWIHKTYQDLNIYSNVLKIKYIFTEYTSQHAILKENTNTSFQWCRSRHHLEKEFLQLDKMILIALKASNS